jgi:solute carrier family 25 protein 34/35
MGLYRGSALSAGRSVVGSGANLASYSLIKESLLRNGGKDSVTVDMIAGLASGGVTCLFINPIGNPKSVNHNKVSSKSTL